MVLQQFMPVPLFLKKGKVRKFRQTKCTGSQINWLLRIDYELPA